MVSGAFFWHSWALHTHGEQIYQDKTHIHIKIMLHTYVFAFIIHKKTRELFTCSNPSKIQENWIILRIWFYSPVFSVCKGLLCSKDWPLWVHLVQVMENEVGIITFLNMWWCSYSLRFTCLKPWHEYPSLSLSILHILWIQFHAGFSF